MIILQQLNFIKIDSKWIYSASEALSFASEQIRRNLKSSSQAASIDDGETPSLNARILMAPCSGE